MINEKFDYDYADDVKMYEIVEFDPKSSEWVCLGIYAETEQKASQLKFLLNAQYNEEFAFQKLTNLN